jgi:hypothetical protein
MKAQYVGDIGDFSKVLLLKYLAGRGFKIGINWVLTENDDGTDGKHRDYPWYGIRHQANNPLFPRKLKPDDRRDCLACCTSEQVLQGIALLAATPKVQRRIESLEKLLINALCTEPAFFGEHFRDGDDRTTKCESALIYLRNSNLVFFDPDNGIIPTKAELRKSPKHIYLDELLEFWGKQKSLLVYHHWSRVEGGNLLHMQQIEAKLKDSLDGCKVFQYSFRRGSGRTYLLAVHPDHYSLIPSARMNDFQAIKPLTFTMGEWRRRAKPCEAVHPWQFTPAAPPPSPSPPAPDQTSPA